MNLLLSNKVKTKYSNEQVGKTKDLIKLLLKVSVPAALETFFVGLMGVFDTMMVGGFSKEALSAVSICQQPVCITLCFAWGLNVGITACIARRKGENDPVRANAILRQGLLLGLLVSLLFMGLVIAFGREFCIFSGAKDDTIDLCETYLKIVSYCLPFNYIRLIICAAQRSLGHTKIVLLVNVVSNLVNVFLNYLLINGNWGMPRLGVAGAAIATNIGNFLAALIIFLTVYRRKNQFLSIRFKDSFKFDNETIGLVVRVALPAFIEQLAMRFGFFIIAKVVNELGTDETAVNAIISNLISINFYIVDGFALGTCALVGQSLGQKNHLNAYAYGRLAQIGSLLVGVVMSIITIIFRKPLCMAFSKDAEIYEAASELCKIIWLILIPQAVQWTTTGILKGSGDTGYCARTSIITVAIVRPICSYLLCWTLGLGVLGSWLGMLTDQVIRLTLNYIRFSKLNWLEKKA